MSIFEVKNTILKSILQDLKNNVTIPQWISHASHRFSQKKNPLSLLFEGHGLRELSSMFNTEKENYSTADLSRKLTCVRGSWCYKKLGEYLYSHVWEFKPSTWLQKIINEHTDVVKGGEKVGKLKAQGWSNWDIISKTRKYRKLWLQNFKVSKNITKSEELGRAWKMIEIEMANWLKALTINIHNASTFAVEYLLEHNLEIPGESEIQHSKWNKVTLVTKNTAVDKEILLKKVKKVKRRSEREFKRQFGVWSRELEKPNQT